MCMNCIDDEPALTHTLRRVAEFFPGQVITLIAPEFDKGNLDDFTHAVGDAEVKVLYAHDASPLLRMLQATPELPDEGLIIRIDGLNFCVDAPSLLSMRDKAVEDCLDLIKFPDDWPSLFTADVYRVGALRQMLRDLEALPPTQASPHHIHPKYFMLQNAARFNCRRYAPQAYATALLQACRERAHYVYEEREIASDAKRAVPAADTLSFHYQLALPHVTSADRVLDIACGYGFGAAMLAGKARHVTGADLDTQTLINVSRKYANITNLCFTQANGLAMPFADGSFDVVVSFETIEHLAAENFLAEVARVLVPGGRFIMSTPQNALGHIPVNPHHVIEYSLEQITTLVNRVFSIDQTIGIKQGTLIFKDDPKGSNTILICHKP